MTASWLYKFLLNGKKKFKTLFKIKNEFLFYCRLFGATETKARGTGFKLALKQQLRTRFKTQWKSKPQISEFKTYENFCY